MKPSQKSTASNKEPSSPRLATDGSSYQVDNKGQKCNLGTHEYEGKCQANTTNCKTYETKHNSCTECNFFYWKSNSYRQGNYCYNKWWMWGIICASAVIGLSLLISVISYFACCNDCCSFKKDRDEIINPYQREMMEEPSTDSQRRFGASQKYHTF